jgi:uncharacterized protein YqjF (DUF2071 family)
VIIGSQEWRELLFSHHRVPAAALRPLVPAALSIDEREGSAWVFSLDAASPAAVAIARFSVRLPYHRAKMERGDGWYRSQRTSRPASYDARWTVSREAQVSAPGSLNEFLAERYTL